MPVRLGLQALVVFLSRREALTPTGAVEVLGAFDLAAGPHVLALLWLHAHDNPYSVPPLFFLTACGVGPMALYAMAYHEN